MSRGGAAPVWGGQATLELRGYGTPHNEGGGPRGPSSDSDESENQPANSLP